MDLEHRPHHAALGSQGGAVDDGALGAGDEGHDGPDFLGFLEALQERTGAHLFKELLLNLRGGHVLLAGQVLQEAADALGAVWAPPKPS